MTARVYSLQLEKARLKGADDGAYRQPQQGGKDIDRMGHRAHSLRPVLDASSKFDDLSREAGTLESHLAREALKLLHDCHRVGAQTASGYLSLWATAVALIDSSLKCTANALHRAALLGTDATVQGSHGKKFTRETGNVRS